MAFKAGVDPTGGPFSFCCPVFSERGVVGLWDEAHLLQFLHLHHFSCFIQFLLQRMIPMVSSKLLQETDLALDSSVMHGLGMESVLRKCLADEWTVSDTENGIKSTCQRKGNSQEHSGKSRLKTGNQRKKCLEWTFHCQAHLGEGKLDLECKCLRREQLRMAFENRCRNGV